jgi:hypothetical protein
MYRSMCLHGDPSTRRPGSYATRSICYGRIRTLALLTAHPQPRSFSATWTRAEFGLGRPKGREQKLQVLARRSLRPFDGRALTGWPTNIGQERLGKSAGRFVAQSCQPWHCGKRRSPDYIGSAAAPAREPACPSDCGDPTVLKTNRETGRIRQARFSGVRSRSP